MKWCQSHWDQLRAAIEIRSLSKFGAQNSEQCHKDMVAQVEGKSTDFDPLMGSFWQINSQMLKDIGLRAMEHCPLCILVEDGQPHLVENWINGVTDSAKEYALSQGLIDIQ